MTATIVTKSNLLSESYTNIKALINNKSNVVDPTTSSSEYRKWIYTRDPDVKSNDFSGFPYIIIHPISLEPLERRTLDMMRAKINWMAQIEVVTSDREWNNREGKGAEDNDSISEDIIETFNKKANRQTLSGNSMKFSDPSCSTAIAEPFHNTLIYRRTIFISFSTLKEVS